jgi:uncharacterized surface protein with fasciclin (FAS1) repeats
LQSVCVTSPDILQRISIEKEFDMKILKMSVLVAASAFALAACSSEAPVDTSADDTAMADGAATDADTANTTPAGDMAAPVADAAGTQTIVALAQGNPDLSTLVSAVTAAGLGETLSGTGPFTVFAPTNAAFAKVDKATLDGLMKPESKAALANILKYHVVAGNVKAADVVKLIKDGGGTATIKTMGGELKAKMEGDKVVLTDAKGGKSTITATDIAASNGVVHTIDTVVMPK